MDTLYHEMYREPISKKNFFLGLQVKHLENFFEFHKISSKFHKSFNCESQKKFFVKMDTLYHEMYRELISQKIFFGLQVKHLENFFLNFTKFHMRVSYSTHYTTSFF